MSSSSTTSSSTISPSSSSALHASYTLTSIPPVSSLPTQSTVPASVSSSSSSPPLPHPFPPLHSTTHISSPPSSSLPISPPISSPARPSSVVHYHSQSPARTRTHSVSSHSDDVIRTKEHSSDAKNDDVCNKNDSENFIVADKNVKACELSDDKKCNPKDQINANNKNPLGESAVGNKNVIANVGLNKDVHEDDKVDINCVSDEEESVSSVKSTFVSLLELQEEQTNQRKLHEIQQEIIQQQQKELQFLKNDVFRKVAEKEKEKEELKIQRDILLDQAELKKSSLTNNSIDEKIDCSTKVENNSINKNDYIGVKSNEKNQNKKNTEYSKNNVTYKSELDDPYEDLPRPKKTTFVPERSLEYLSPKERSIRNSQLKKSESNNLIVASKSVRNSHIPHRQNVPITDHIQVS